MMGGAGIAVGLFVVLWVLLFALNIAGFVFWIVKLIEVIRIPDAQYRGAGTEKLTWGLLVGLLGWIGALVWHFSKRAQVLAATPVPTVSAPPGWYPDPHTGQMTWFDGYRWWPGSGGPGYGGGGGGPGHGAGYVGDAPGAPGYGAGGGTFGGGPPPYRPGPRTPSAGGIT